MRSRAPRSASMFYDLEAQGTTLTGALRIDLPGVPDIPARPITGSRTK